MSTKIDFRGTAYERFISKIDFSATCWNWNGGKHISGYGGFNWNRKTSYAHRFSYLLFKGELIKGLVIDHLCRNRSCVNPEHLEQVDEWTNLMRAGARTYIRAMQTECIHGHPFNKLNTYIRKEGQRMCRECKRIMTRKWRQNHLEKARAYDRARYRKRRDKAERLIYGSKRKIYENKDRETD